MPSITKGLWRASDLSISQRHFLLVLVSIGSSILHTPAYLKSTFYDPPKEAIDTSNAGVDGSLGCHTITTAIYYFPSGVVTDKVGVRTPVWIGSTSTAMLAYLCAMLLSFAVLRFVSTGMGVTTILIWWDIRFKLVRLISEKDTYSRSIGISCGLYGAAELAAGLSSIGIIGLIASVFGGSNTLRIQTLLFSLGTLTLILGILSLLYIPKFEGEIDPTKKSFDVRLIRETLRNPVVQMSAACLFCTCFFYTDLSYTTPYLTVLPTPRILTGVVSILRTYGIILASGPVFGLPARVVDSPSKVIFGGSLVCAGDMLVLAILPAEPVVIILVAMFIILLRFITNGVFEIVSSQLAEGEVPIPIFGTAAGILSVTDSLPDSFPSTWFGKTIDDQSRGAYTEVFLILAGLAVAGAAFVAVLLWYVKHRWKVEQVGSAPSEPTLVPSYEEVAEPAAAARSTFDPKKNSNKGSTWSSHIK